MAGGRFFNPPPKTLPQNPVARLYVSGCCLRFADILAKEDGSRRSESQTIYLEMTERDNLMAY